MKPGATIICITEAVSLGVAALAQDAPPPSDKKVEYFPYPEQSFPNHF